MKKIIGISLMSLFLGFASVSQAQSKVKETTKEVGKDVKEGTKKGAKAVKKGGKKAGHKTASVASKGKNRIVHEVYNDKVGPEGQTIYINGKGKYFWIDEKGRKHYVTAAQLRDKS